LVKRLKASMFIDALSEIVEKNLKIFTH